MVHWWSTANLISIEQPRTGIQQTSAIPRLFPYISALNDAPRDGLQVPGARFPPSLSPEAVSRIFGLIA